MKRVLSIQSHVVHGCKWKNRVRACDMMERFSDTSSSLLWWNNTLHIMYVIRRRQQSRCLSTSIVGLWCRLYQFGAFLQSHGISKWLEGRRPEWRSTAIHPTGTGSQWFTARCGVLIDGIYWIGLLFRSRDWCAENHSTAQSRFGVCVWSRWVEVLKSSSSHHSLSSYGSRMSTFTQGPAFLLISFLHFIFFFL